MKMLDTNNKLSSIVVTDNDVVEIRFRIDNAWLDLPLAPFSRQLHSVFSTVRQQIQFEEAYYNIILEDECDTLEETIDFIDMYVVELVEVLLGGKILKFKEERWGTTNEVWDQLNLTEVLKRKLLNYECIIRYFNITILGKDGEVAYKLLDD